MRDELEKFIAVNREAFDSEEPAPHLWEAIDKNLSEPRQARRISLFQPLAVAASALIVLGLGVVIGLSMQGSFQAGGKEVVLAEVEEAEDYYQREVGEKMALLASYDQTDPEVTEDMAQLDSLIDELKLELANIPKGNEEEVINAIIQNYRAKIAILERVLETYRGNSENEVKNSEENE